MICKDELEMDIQTLVFGSSCCLASLSGQNPDVSFYESLLSLIYPPTVRPSTRFKIILSWWHKLSFKQAMKRYLNGENESPWEVGGRWLHLDHGL